MNEVIHLDNGTVVSLDGEILECGVSEDMKLAWLASQFRLACEQTEAWERTKRALSRVFVKAQEEKRVIYGDVSVRIGGGSRSSHNGEAFGDLVWERYGDAFYVGNSGDPSTRAVLDIIAAAKAFDRDKLPEKARELLDSVTTKTETASYAVAEVVRRPAPRIEERDDVSE